MEFNGTKGKWVASTNFDGNPCVELIEPGWSVGKTFIVEELGQEDTSYEDAHLIAAAPDLLEACIKMMDAIGMFANDLLAPEGELMATAIHKALNITK